MNDYAQVPVETLDRLTKERDNLSALLHEALEANDILFDEKKVLLAQNAELKEALAVFVAAVEHDLAFTGSPYELMYRHDIARARVLLAKVQP